MERKGEKKTLYGLTRRQSDEAAEFAARFLGSEKKDMTIAQWMAVCFHLLYAVIRMAVRGGMPLPHAIDMAREGFMHVLDVCLINMDDMKAIFDTDGKEAS